MMDTPAKMKMNIALLNIPFAIVGIAVAIVPLIIGMRYQVRPDNEDVVATRNEDLIDSPRTEELERAA